jgi:hypothetical protein
MRKRTHTRRGFGARFIAVRRHLSEDDDPLFDERDIIFAGASDERVTPSKC